MHPLILLIKSASAGCNMCCQYCFYADTAKKRITASYGTMSLSTLENLVRKALRDAGGYCIFAFQGGEPTLAGLDYYKALIKFVKKHNHKQLKVNYAIQTNGYDINREWAEFLARYKFLVGVSLDGTGKLHNLYRHDITGKGTFSKVMHTLQLFNQYGVEYNILTVVTAQTAKNIQSIYGFFKRNHFTYQQYIPCLNPFHEERGQQAYSLTPELYDEFLCTLFDLWYIDIINRSRVSIRYFDNMIQMLAGYPPESCGMMGQCCRQIVVEADGSVYPCDFYVLDEYRLGNLNHDDFPQIEIARNGIGFIEASMQASPECVSCDFWFLCKGGCRRDRESGASFRLPLNYYCPSYQQFFAYAYSRLEKAGRYLQITE